MAILVTQESIQNQDEYMKNYARLIGKVWGDPQFKAALIKDPVPILKQMGFAIPDGIKVQIIEDTADTVHMTIPYDGAVELSDVQLDHVSGGDTSTSSTSATIPSCVSSVSTAC